MVALPGLSDEACPGDKTDTPSDSDADFIDMSLMKKRKRRPRGYKQPKKKTLSAIAFKFAPLHRARGKSHCAHTDR